MPYSNQRRTFFYGYVVVAAAFLVMVVSSGAIYSFSVFFAPLQEEFGWTRAVTSGAFSSYLVVQGTLSIWTGRLNDRFGPRAILTICGVLFGLGFFLMSRVTAVWQLYLLYGVLVAAGFSGVPVPLMSTIARWFRARRGMMTGIMMAGTGVGTMFLPPSANWLIHTLSWRSSYMVVGLVLMAVVVLSAQFLRRDATKVGHRSRESDRLANTPAPEGEPEGLPLSGALRTRQLWLLVIVFAVFGFVLQSIMVHVVVHAIGLGVSSTIAAGIMTAIGGMGIVGRVGVGSLADKYGSRRLLIAQFALLSLGMFWLAGMHDVWAIYAFGLAFGFAYGGIVPLYSHVVAEFFGLKAHGAILGTLTFSAGIGSAVGPVFTGYSFDVLGAYVVPFATCGALAAVAVVLLCFLRPLTAPEDQDASPV